MVTITSENLQFLTVTLYLYALIDFISFKF